MSSNPDEDLIEATIRRVAASKAARLPDPIDEPADAFDNHAVIAPSLHLVPATGEHRRDAAPPARPAADESLIEATLRRIEAQQAERAADAAADGSPAHEALPERDTSPDLHLVRSGDDGHDEVPLPLSAPPTSAHLPLDIAPEQESADTSAGAPSSDIAALRRDLDDTRRQLIELSARVEAMLGSPAEQARRSNHPQPALAQSGARATSGHSDDDFDDAPALTRMDTGLPPRPAIIRDPSPMPAPGGTIEQPKSAAPTTHQAEPIPAAPAGAAPKRGFDLLPRTYRITVEDKRRGVDLVPLHRALLGMAGVRDMSLLSYSNGTAIVALEATTEIAPDALGAAVSHAMAREVEVEVHNEQTMVVKLAED